MVTRGHYYRFARLINQLLSYMDIQSGLFLSECAEPALSVGDRTSQSEPAGDTTPAGGGAAGGGAL